MALAHAQVACEVGHALAVQRAGRDSLCREPRQPRDRVHQGTSRRQLGAAAETRAIARPLGGRGGVEEPPPVGVGDPRGAHRAAVHAGRGDPDEEDSVESHVPRAHGALADIRLEHEGI